MQTTDRDAAFISALTTEHFVIQSSMSATNGESAQRASLYVFALSSGLVALGFVSRSPQVFAPFIATILPAIFLIGVFTSVRLVDANLEMMQLLRNVARIREYYRTLSPDGQELFSPESGRWPEGTKPPALWHGVFIGFITTNASMIAMINSIVGGVGIALLMGRWSQNRDLAAALGIVFAIAHMTLFMRISAGATRVLALRTTSERKDRRSPMFGRFVAGSGEGRIPATSPALGRLAANPV